MKVAQQDGGFWTSDDKNDKHQKQETKHVVGLVRPKNIKTFLSNIILIFSFKYKAALPKMIDFQSYNSAYPSYTLPMS